MEIAQNKKVIEVHPETRGLIFDLDGTLIDSMPVHYQAWRAVLAGGGLDFSETEFYSLAGIPSDRIIEILNQRHGTRFQPEADSAKKEDLYMQMIADMRPVQPVMDVVLAYHGKLPMTIGTGGPRAHSLKIVQSMKLDRYFEVLVSKNDVKEGKPNPETFLKCAESMRVEPRFCQVFEDGDPGIQAAKAAGMRVTDIREYV